MTEKTRFVRRNRVDERVAIGIAIVSGLIAATAGAQPTGAAVIGNGLTVNAGGANITGATSVTDGNANLTVSSGAASLTVTNAGGTQNGIVITIGRYINNYQYIC